jgi:alkanesulfonate monooxygenase SsuD/methylene tetrahydromethanopterin reductase-like flavin-dependent oxidoreductase (luciferase family)
VRRLAVAAEEFGADWLGLPDAFWWRDTWFLTFDALSATEQIVVGPLVTNPYLRHPVHTASVIATLQDRFGARIQLGVGAGGSELTAVTGISRRDAASRIEALAELVRTVATGAPYDDAGGLRLDLPLKRPDIIVAGRSKEVLQTAGRVGDRALLWSVPSTDLSRSIDFIRVGATQRSRQSRSSRVDIIWAPAVAHDAQSRRHHLASLPYAVLNSRAVLQRGWGIDQAATSHIRRLVNSGHIAEAAELVPNAAASDLIVASPDPSYFAERIHALGIDGLAIPIFRVQDVEARMKWARAVEAAL